MALSSQQCSQAAARFGPPRHICYRFCGYNGAELGGHDSKSRVKRPRCIFAEHALILGSFAILFPDSNSSTRSATFEPQIPRCRCVHYLDRVSDLLIGALDETMMLACAKAHVPCVEIQGGEVSKELAGTTGTNLRSRPSLYPKMSVLKVRDGTADFSFSKAATHARTF